MSVFDERLPPERRFRLYSRIACVFEEAGQHEPAEKAREIAAEALRESPELQEEMRKLLEAMRKEVERE